MTHISQDSKSRRQKKVRSKLSSSLRARVSVYRSNKYLYAQVIDGQKAHTVASISTKQKESKEKQTKTQTAKNAGIELAKKLISLKIKEVVFDRGSYKYGGRVAAFADGLREGGITI